MEKPKQSQLIAELSGMFRCDGQDEVLIKKGKMKNQFGYCCDYFYGSLCTGHIKPYQIPPFDKTWAIESNSKQKYKVITYCPFCSKELSNYKME